MKSRDRIRRRLPRWAWLAVVPAAAVLIALAVTVTRHADADHTMSDRAAQVMPFDLAATTHTFAKSDTGGVEQVVADDAGDTRNIELIRSHLRAEATRFQQGDYSDPASIHGGDMPGLADLRSGAGRITVSYEQIAAGARITYLSADPALVAALHAWFDRQSTDHSMPGMG